MIADNPAALTQRLVQDRFTTSPAPARIVTDREPYALLLHPAVTNVLIHELVGHGVEEETRPEALIGPPSLTATTSVPAGWATDDEGIPVDRRPLVVDGRLATPLGSRAGVRHGARCGHAQAASHARTPIPRCTHLTVDHDVTALTGEPDTDLRRLIVCAEPGDCTFDGRNATITVRRPLYMRGGEPLGTTDSLTFRLTPQEFKDHFAGFRGPSLATPLGSCDKGDQTLLTMNTVPACLLIDMPVQITAR
jgi:hypothetical protein